MEKIVAAVAIGLVVVATGFSLVLIGNVIENVAHGWNWLLTPLAELTSIISRPASRGMAV
jgi:hypothetical protein